MPSVMSAERSSRPHNFEGIGKDTMCARHIGSPANPKTSLGESQTFKPHSGSNLGHSHNTFNFVRFKVLLQSQEMPNLVV